MMLAFGRVILSRKEYEKYKNSNIRELQLVSKNNDLKDRIAEMGLEITKSIVAESYKKQLIDVDVGDPSPTDIVKRREYVAKVAGLHKEILEPKLKQMISVSHNLSESLTTDRDFDLIMKGVTYLLRDFIKWGESMVSEQVANQIGENPSSEKDKTTKEE